MIQLMPLRVIAPPLTTIEPALPNVTPSFAFRSSIQTVPSMLRVFLILLLLVLPAVSASGQVMNRVPEPLQGIDVNERLGERVDLDRVFLDEKGEPITFRDLQADGLPILLTLNYYNCPMLCSLQLNALTDAMAELDWMPGERFQLVTISFDAREGAELATAKRRAYEAALGREGAQWRFLTGSQESIDGLTEELGYVYRWVEEAQEFAHPSVLMFIGTEGLISRYIYGLQYRTADVRLALLEASEGRIGSTLDRVILSCFIFDPNRGQYVPFAMGVMRAAGVVTLLILSLLLLLLWWRDRAAAPHAPQGES